MADNFLEKRMEDFRNGKMSVAGKKRDTSNDPVVFISGGCSEKGKAAVKDYRSRNYRVAFCDTDRKAEICLHRFPAQDSIRWIPSAARFLTDAAKG